MGSASSLSIQWDSVPGSDIACVSLVGEIDMRAENELVLLAEKLGVYRTVYLDIAGVVFAGTTLVHFLVALLHAMPRGGCMMVCRPGPMTMKLLSVTSIDLVVPVSERLPLRWVKPARAPRQAIH